MTGVTVLPASALSLGLFRTGLTKFEDTLDPWVKGRASAVFKDRWLYECRGCVGRDLKKHVDPEKTWDTHTLCAIMRQRYTDFLG